jgi:hypothetical protein
VGRPHLVLAMFELLVATAAAATPMPSEVPAVVVVAAVLVGQVVMAQTAAHVQAILDSLVPVVVAQTADQMEAAPPAAVPLVVVTVPTV